MSKKLNHEGFLIKIKKVYPNNEYSVLSEYENMKTKIRVRHNSDKCNNYEWDVFPDSLLRGYSHCPKCSGKNKKTTEEFNQEVFELVGDEYSVVGEYKAARFKIRMRHNCAECNNHEWETYPSSFLQGHRCPICLGGIKKNPEKYNEEIFNLFGNEYSILSTYESTSKKILVRHNCKKCNNYEWEVFPHALLKGIGCLKCAGNQKKTTKSFKQEVFDLVGDEYSVLGEYVNSQTKIKIKHNCKNCNNYEYEVVPSSFLRGRRCPRCFKFWVKTTEEFEQEVFDLVGDEYSVLGEYVNAKTKIKIKHNCKDCNNYEYETTPDKFLRGSRCPQCCKNWTKTTEEFKQEVFDLVGDEYFVLGEYVKAKTKIKIKHNCKNCNNYEYETTPEHFLRGNRCPKCFKKFKKTTEEFKQEVFDLVGDEYFVLGEYVNFKTKIRVRHNCNKCNNFEYEVSPEHFFRGNRCPKCSVSRGEKAIYNYCILKGIHHKVQYKFDDCKNIESLSFDCAIFNKYNKLIGLVEYDGEQHFKPIKYFGGKEKFKLTKLRDSIKTKYCEENNIPLLRIKYTQFDDIELILNHFLKNPNNYIKNHSYGITNEEYYEELKAS